MSFDELRDAFHLRLGRLMQITAQLDLNIGLAVSWLGQNNGMDVSNLIDPEKTRLSLRLGMLKKLVDLTADQRTQQKAAEFAQWFARANSLPALHSNYLHAKWSFHRIADGDEPYVLFKVPGWNHLPDKPDNGTKLTLKDFDQQIEALKQLNQDVNTMCDCRVAYVAPFKGAFVGLRGISGADAAALAIASAMSTIETSATPIHPANQTAHARPSASAHRTALN